MLVVELVSVLELVLVSMLVLVLVLMLRLLLVLVLGLKSGLQIRIRVGVGLVLGSAPHCYSQRYPHRQVGDPRGPRDRPRLGSVLRFKNQATMP